MADVRLTAINPEDSSVVPVTCDASGRLLLEERGVGPQGPPGPQGDPGQDGQDGDPFSGNFADNVTFGGSASFAGLVTGEAGGSFSGGSFTISRAAGNNTGLIVGINNSPRMVIDARGTTYIGTDNNGQNSTITLQPDGSANFAGGKAGFTAEGYLWCTTRRGDTVILDATSQGMGVWVEYTPTRKDEIRDRLDALREETPDTGADTQ